MLFFRKEEGTMLMVKVSVGVLVAVFVIGVVRIFWQGRQTLKNPKFNRRHSKNGRLLNFEVKETNDIRAGREAKKELQERKRLSKQIGQAKAALHFTTEARKQELANRKNATANIKAKQSKLKAKFK